VVVLPRIAEFAEMLTAAGAANEHLGLVVQLADEVLTGVALVRELARRVSDEPLWD